MLREFGPQGFWPRNRIAVIGSGIAGLAAAWHLSQQFDVTLYEADARIGGHSNTVDIDMDGKPIAVDTGFIVFNEKNYPNLVALFDHLGVKSEASNMSFAASVDDGAFEYESSGIMSVLGKPGNAISPRFWRMLSDIVRFYREAPEMLTSALGDRLTLGGYLDEHGFSDAFVKDHILPMGAAIWSTNAHEMRNYPLRTFVRFFANHGLLSLTGRPVWRTVSGGSRTYVKKLLQAFRGTVRTGSPVAQVVRGPSAVTVTTSDGNRDVFGQVVIATHANQARALLGDMDDRENNLLGAFGYTSNRAVLHSDSRLMPKSRAIWSSWNYMGRAIHDENQQLCVTYWMNKLQNLKTRRPVLVTLNPNREIDEKAIFAAFDYEHPLFDRRAIEAQKNLWDIQGRGGVWFCGAHFGSGFHEDGLQAGLAVAEQISGVRRPWTVADESGRIHLPANMQAAE